jgi:hypothetical protein
MGIASDNNQSFLSIPDDLQSFSEHAPTGVLFRPEFDAVGGEVHPENHPVFGQAFH